MQSMATVARKVASRFLRAVRPQPAAKETIGAVDRFDLPQITLSELLGEAQSCDISIRATQVERPRDMVLPLPELVSISLMCRTLAPRKVFEIGTFTGETTWSMARNLPATSEVLTLDIPRDEIPHHFVPYVAGAYFAGSPESGRITQLFGWSNVFDFSPYVDSIDMVFIDGDHSRDAVAVDTRSAIKIARSGGLIVWDDYRFAPYHRSCSGVSQCLHELMHELPIYQLSGTRLAVMKVR